MLKLNLEWLGFKEGSPKADQKKNPKNFALLFVDLFVSMAAYIIV